MIIIIITKTTILPLEHHHHHHHHHSPTDRINGLKELHLLHNFIVASCHFNLDKEPSLPHENDAVALGFSRHYLLHSIIALSALHLFSMGPSSPQRKRYYYQATSHQDAAIRQARPHLVHLSEEHCEAHVLVFGVYIAVCACGAIAASQAIDGREQQRRQ
ncbi:hypothetical protein VTN00DRAFT_9018 [Thermoascus crustaceus]|uniref:uncharacterized protein n=1 Tax=Thermoascus crustaceus TaxID=5088 RepID=UPI0037441D24